MTQNRRIQLLHDSFQLVFFKNYHIFHRHHKKHSSANGGVETTETEEILIGQLPNILYPSGVSLPQKRDGEMPRVFDCPILTDFLMLKNSDCNPTKFLHDVDVFTTLSSLRSLICQWVDGWSSKSVFFKKNCHYCHMDSQGRVFLNTGTNYTVPLERSTSLLHRFTILAHGQTWQEFIGTSYSGLAKIRLKNGIRVAFTYKMYAQSNEQPVDIIVRSASSFQREIEFHFLNCLLTRKRLWRYDINKNRTVFQESLGSEELWNRLSSEKRLKILRCFEKRLPDFLLDVAYGIRSEQVVNVVGSVTSPSIRLIERTHLEMLY